MRALLLGLLLWQIGSEERVADAPKPEPRHFLNLRTVTVAGGGARQACVTLDGQLYAHAAASLKDVRLFAGEREVPYALTLSEPVEAERATARVTNRGLRGGKIVLDLEMPPRPYTDVVLDLAAHDFVARAEVSGTNAAGEVATKLGTFTLFDLGTRHLSRDTTLPLQESTLRMLHIELTMAAAPGSPREAVGPEMVLGATVPPSREAQTVYTTVAEKNAFSQRGRETIISLPVPARVPVERILFTLDPAFKGNFSRSVQVQGRTTGSEEALERIAGVIERVRLDEGGRELRQEMLSVPATLGVNLQEGATVEMTVENGDDPPLPLTAVRLEMRERRLCFPAEALTGLTLFYGDAALKAPVYDFAHLFVQGRGVAMALLGPEERNGGYAARTAAARSLTERHPELFWVALLGVVCVLGVVALHSARKL